MEKDKIEHEFGLKRAKFRSMFLECEGMCFCYDFNSIGRSSFKHPIQLYASFILKFKRCPQP